MAISSINTVNNSYLNIASSQRVKDISKPEAGNAASAPKTNFFNPNTGAAMTSEEAEQVYQQVTSQPNWNRHDINFYAGPPAAIRIPEKISAPTVQLNVPDTNSDVVISIENEIEIETKIGQASLNDPKTGAAITPEEAEQVYQQVTSQPNWNRHDINFYAGSPAARIIGEKQSAAASVSEATDVVINTEDQVGYVQSSAAADKTINTDQVELPISMSNNTVQVQSSDLLKAETASENKDLLKPLWNKRDFEYYQRWLAILTGNDSDEPAWKKPSNSTGHRFWDAKV